MSPEWLIIKSEKNLDFTSSLKFATRKESLKIELYQLFVGFTKTVFEDDLCLILNDILGRLFFKMAMNKDFSKWIKKHILSSSCLLSCLIYVICVCLCIVVSNTYSVVFFFVLYTLCCQFLWIHHCFIAPSVFFNVYLTRQISAPKQTITTLYAQPL